MQRPSRFIFIPILFFIACGGGIETRSPETTSPPENNSPQPEVSDRVAATSGAVAAVTGGLQNILGNLVPATAVNVSLALKAAEGERDFPCTCTETVSDGVQKTISCSCSCPGGGTMAMETHNRITQGVCMDAQGAEDKLFTVLASTHVQFTACALSKCGENLKLDGVTTAITQGQVSECLSSFSFNSTLETAETCGGLNVTTDGGAVVAAGYRMLWEVTRNQFGDLSRNVDGSFCTNPPGADGTVSFDSEEELLASIDPQNTCEAAAVPFENVFFFAATFGSSGQLYAVSYDEVGRLANTGMANLGSSAVARLYEGKLYILHDGFSFLSSDNVEIINPLTMEVTGQWSTGNGTNPHEIIVAGNKAFISLYDPDRDAENIAANGKPGDVVIMDLAIGGITYRLSFDDFLNDDGFRVARASPMASHGDDIYVGIQDLEADFSANSSGKLAVIDQGSAKIRDVISLEGRNPMSLAISPDMGKIFVAQMATYNFTIGNYDLSTDFGGVEILSLSDPDERIFIADNDLGGYVERVAANAGYACAVASQMDGASFTFTSDIWCTSDPSAGLAGFKLFLDGGQDVRDIAIDARGRLWVSLRSIAQGTGTASDPSVQVFDLATGSQVGATLTPIVPVTSIAIGEI